MCSELCVVGFFFFFQLLCLNWTGVRVPAQMCVVTHQLASHDARTVEAAIASAPWSTQTTNFSCVDTDDRREACFLLI